MPSEAPLLMPPAPRRRRRCPGHQMGKGSMHPKSLLGLRKKKGLAGWQTRRSPRRVGIEGGGRWCECHSPGESIDIKRSSSPPATCQTKSLTKPKPVCWHSPISAPWRKRSAMGPWPPHPAASYFIFCKMKARRVYIKIENGIYAGGALRVELRHMVA